MSEHSFDTAAGDELQLLRHEFKDYKKVAEQRLRNLELELDNELQAGEATSLRLEDKLHVELTVERGKTQSLQRALTKALSGASEPDLLVAERQKAVELQRALATALCYAAEQRRARGTESDEEDDDGELVEELRSVLGAALVDGVDGATQTSPQTSPLRSTSHFADLMKQNLERPMADTSAGITAVKAVRRARYDDDLSLVPGRVELQARVALLEEQMAEKDSALGRLKQRQSVSSPSNMRSQIASLERQLLSLDSELLDKENELFRKDQELFATRLGLVHNELLGLDRFSDNSLAARASVLARSHLDVERYFPSLVLPDTQASIGPVSEYGSRRGSDNSLNSWGLASIVSCPNESGRSSPGLRSVLRSLASFDSIPEDAEFGSSSTDPFDMVGRVAPQLDIGPSKKARPQSEYLVNARISEGVEFVD